MISDRNIASDARIALSKIAGGGIGTTGNVWYVNPVSGGANNSGKTPGDALSTLTAALAKVTDNNNDVILYAGDTSSLSESSITWSKSYTHLVGVGSATRNNRARIFQAAAGAGTTHFTITGSGNTFSNIAIGTFVDTNINLALTSASRNHFYNCSIMGIGDATAGDDAAARSIVFTGSSENRFEKCTIGLDTVMRSTTNTEIEFATGSTRNEFFDCKFVKAADNVGSTFVKSTGASGLDRENEFRNCIWYSFWTNDADKITAAFDLSAQTATAHIILSGTQMLIGVDDWEGTATGRLYMQPATATANAIGLAINPTVS